MTTTTTTCSFFQCGRNVYKVPTLRTFGFPVKDPSRCDQWIINSGNANLLNLSSTELKKRFLCEIHFRKEDLLTRRLTKTAVPLAYSHTHNTSTKANEPTPSSSSLTRQEIIFLTPTIELKDNEDTEEVDPLC